MAGVKALRKIQLGAESTQGTAVAATTIWRGMGLSKDLREVKNVPELVGVATGTDRNYITKLGAEIKLDAVEATFQQLPYIFEAGVSIETPTQDGAGSDYIYVYSLPTTTVNTIRTYTVEMGDNQLAQESDFCFVQSFKISGNAAEGVMMESAWMGRDIADAPFTPALSVPALVPSDHLVFGGSDFFIDTVDGTIGTTEIDGTLLSFELNVTTGLKAKFTNTSKEFTRIYFDIGTYNATLKLVYEHDSVADAQRDLYEAATSRQIRLTFTGGAVATPGTTYSNMQFDIDCAGVYTTFPQGDVDGNATVDAEMNIKYNLTAGLGLTFRVVNELSALP